MSSSPNRRPIAIGRPSSRSPNKSMTSVNPSNFQAESS